MGKILVGGVMRFDATPLKGQTELSYLWNIGQAKDNGNYDGTWDDIANIMNEYYRKDESEYRTSSAYRKPYEQAKKFYENGVFNKFNEDEYVKKLQKSKKDLEEEKIKIRDERRAYNKQNSTDARVSDLLDKLSESLMEIGKVNFQNHIYPSLISDNDMIVLLSDLHIGATFDNSFGRYNTDIAEERIRRYLDSVIDIQALHHCENCYVLSLGDQISGIIHKNIQVTNRENVVEQIKIATQLISNFCYELSHVFRTVNLISVSGNHSRFTSKKDDCLHDDRLDDIVSWAVGLSLSDVGNFYLKNDNLDTSIATFSIRGKTYVATHGDYDPFTKGDTHKLVSMIREFPEAFFTGHMHTIALDEVNGIKMVRGGSLAGSGDDYTIERRLSGKASQLITIASADGLIAYYPIYF